MSTRSVSVPPRVAPGARRMRASRRSGAGGTLLGVFIGLVLGLVEGVAGPLTPMLALTGATALLGLALLLVRPWRHLGRELLLVSAVAVVVALLVVAGSARFPGGW